VPLLALGATFRVVSPAGAREVPAADFFVLPSENLYQENILAPNEIVTHVVVPPVRGARNATYEVRFKQSHDWPLAMCSAVLEFSGSNVRAARIVLGAVAPVPWRATAAESLLAGKRVTEDVAADAAAAALKDATPMTENAYKVQIARTVVKRAILKAAGLPVPGQA
jgi:xanthine dehydrogenase YagS FAD-binding subunit